MWVGEWAISTNFNATDDFLRKWADAQKLAYSQGAGWLVCLFCLRDKIGHKYNVSPRHSSGTSSLRSRIPSCVNGKGFYSVRELGSTVVLHRSYLEGLRLGYLTQDPSKYNDPNVCTPYRNVSSTTNNSTSSKRGDLSPDSLRRANLHHKRTKRHLLH